MEIIGIGASAKGTVLHIVIAEGEGNQALCDKRTVGLIIDKQLGKKDITCKKCPTYSAYKEMTDGDPPKTEAETTEPAPKTEKKVPRITRKGIPKEKPKKKKEKKELATGPPAGKEDFDIQQMKNGKFKIIHMPSDRVFFQGLGSKVALHLGISLNDMEVKWDGKGGTPGNFISSCKVCMDATYEALNIKKPVPTKTPKEKARAMAKQTPPKKKKIKRRKKIKQEEDSTRLIRRRENSPATFIIKQLEKGCTLGDLTSGLKRTFKFNDKKAMSKIKGVVRKVVKSGDIVTIDLYKDRFAHFYKITETK